MSSSADLMTREPEAQQIRLRGISHLAVNVGDLAAAVRFYAESLGFRHEPQIRLPNCGEHAVVSAASGQRVALCLAASSAQPSPDSAVHQAYRVTRDVRQSIVDRLARQGVEIFSYREMRPAEAADNCYFYDPFGNRIQLVITAAEEGRSDTAVHSIDHAAVRTIDIEWEEKFYVEQLGLPMDCFIGRRTADYVFARRWKEGKENVAPGTMRLDKRYSTIHGTDPVPRPNMQLFVKIGSEALGVYLVNKPFQEPPEELIVGTPRTAFRVSREDLAAIAVRLDAMDHPTSGLIEHPLGSAVRASLYCKDPGANFIEFCC